MKNRFLFLIAFLLACSTGFASVIKPLSVVVIGGGPTGLATAIEARLLGADVVVVEKRKTYTRQNTLFLYKVTLDLLDKWNVDIENMAELELRGERRGFILIKNLEECLAKKVDELGIKRINGEFKDFADGEQAAVIQTADGHFSLTYDILVGADGASSHVREKLNIPCTSFGQAIAGVAMVPATNSEKLIGLETGKHKDVFVKKITIPLATFILIQNRPDTFITEITQRELVHFSREVGWVQEAELIEVGGLLCIENVPIYLQRADSFSHPKRAAILVGDAAGCASFYQGMGANFSLKTAELAGEFFKHCHQEKAYEGFDKNMEKVVNVLMQDSMPLFTK